MIYLFICWFIKFLFNVNCLSLPETVQYVSYEVEKLQIKTSTHGTPPFSWQKDQGLYPSHVKLNFHGELEIAEIRELFKVFDNNMFATAWISSCLIEASMYGIGPVPKSEQIHLSLKAIEQYHDRNRPYNNSIMTFWSQVYNERNRTWESAPKNLLDLFDLTNKFPSKLLEDFLDLIGLKDVAEILEKLLKEKDIFLQAFHIPPDFDDTFVNIGLGSLLKESQFIDLYKEWNNVNTNITSAFTALKKYAYRPFSSDKNQNSIDPRTYFYLRNFLTENLTKSAALVPTWVQNVDEAKEEFYKGVSMPFTINNVDVTVSANAVFGITASLLSELVPKETFDADLQNIYNHTTLMVSYELANNFSNRRDLALTYYPSKIECYWFTARTLAMLRRFKKTQPLPFQIMDTVLNRFTDVFNGPVLDDIVNSAVIDESQRIYFDDFLGDGDIGLDGSDLKRAEDRLFTTSMAMNTLIDAFTVFDPATKKLQWVGSSGTIDKVKKYVDGSVAFLKDFTLGGSYKTWNAFFSGSGKGLKSLPFFYPANRLEFFNGTKIKPDKFPRGGAFVVGFEGVVSDSEYAEMIKQPHFGQPTPIDFDGFNPKSEPEGFFPFWSSDAYTYATTMLGISKYLNIDTVQI
ncbi:uncharacterized protein LOC143056058 [Mytilus galloprovincialis]|uniref:uncharacterized protein LOC143056058 n=1 Tax=Mytilus galloprovincialis TaxID=29158 RepID=UPI003F7CA749